MEQDMKTPHLDHETYLRLRAGELDPATARQLAAHLTEDCDACVSFLAHLPADEMDGATDALLTRLAPPSPQEAGHDIEFARIQRELRRSPAERRPFGWIAAAAAALLVAGGGTWAALHARAAHQAWDGVKGQGPRVIPARLRFAIVDPTSGTPRIAAGRNGTVVPGDQSLAFRIEVGRPAHVALLRIGGEESETVWKGYASRPGVLDVSENGKAAAYPLHGLSGEQRFALVASERQLTAEDLLEAARAARGAGAAALERESPDMTLDVIQIRVQ
jgi:hypothetical protein